MTQPHVLGPAGFYDEKWFNTFFQVSGPGVVDGLTHHSYNLGAGVDSTLINKVQDPYFLDQIAQTYKDISTSVKLFGPWSGAWVGEPGGAYNSGGKDVSHTFANGFWSESLLSLPLPCFSICIPACDINLQVKQKRAGGRGRLRPSSYNRFVTHRISAVELAMALYSASEEERETDF
ncbi:hypothetical protein RJ640_015946 [Escallonia rubra]|uniref:Uncharacterized protein n=1 Tax=Escallonia rubra TaxID=112253 RepID=A0AA88RFP5_9ASTE|nr:hypothetical protein RJ640_015946 [Escallonia rubra]